MTPAQQFSGSAPCPSCGEPVGTDESFCEACGAQVNPDAPSHSPEGSETPLGLSSHTLPTHKLHSGAAATLPPRAAAQCAECGGDLDEQRYCTTCGTRAPKARDHFVQTPAEWVAGCCDRGVRHAKNEDAMALAAQPSPASSATLVVCDGVSSSVGSDVASLAAARTACDLLAESHPRGLGTAESLASAMGSAMTKAVAAANEAVVASGKTGTPAGTERTGSEDVGAASCTFAAAMIADRLLVFGNLGDSRVYWVPDGAPALLLTTDDSIAQVRIAAGVDRAEAESGPGSHTITRWLGADATDIVPQTGALELTAAGWVLVCSDGLWNYASDPRELGELVQSLVGEQGHGDPLPLARRLVDWANEQGGRDNITVALARIPAPTP